MSSFAKQSPLPFYAKDMVSTCQMRHMVREPLTLKDPGAKGGTVASHRWIGANTLLPTYYKYDEQTRAHQGFSVDRRVQRRPLRYGTGASACGRVAWLSPRCHCTRDVLTVSVVIQNKGAAHGHLPEQRDMYESWLQFKVTDAAGSVLTDCAYLKPDGSWTTARTASPTA